ncbi:MAG: hypothetical protein AAF682_29460 [Planctomycetota bacterium]
MHHCRIPLFALSLLPSLPLTASALQGDGSSYQLANVEDLGWDVGIGPGDPFADACAGDFDGDHIPDLMLQKGRAVAFLDSAAAHSSFFELPWVIDDIAKLRGGADGDSDQDSLLTTGPDGLCLVEFDSASGTFTQSVLATGSWVGAVRLRVADLDEDGDDDVLGVASNAFDILKHDNHGGGAWGTKPGFTSDHAVLDVFALEWRESGPPGLEIALNTLDGIQVFDPLFDEIEDVRSAVVDDALAVVRRKTSTDRLAWFTGSPGGSGQVLYVFDDLVVDPILTMPTWQVRACIAADLDGDTDEDLIANGTDGHVLRVFENLTIDPSGGDPPAGAFSLDLGYMSAFELGAEGAYAAANIATPVAYDLSLDGLVDICAAVTTTDNVRMYQGQVISGGSGPPEASEMPFLDLVEVAGTICTGNVTAPSVVDGFDTISFEMVTNSALEQMYSHLGVIVWYQEPTVELVYPIADSFSLHALSSISCGTSKCLDVPVNSSGRPSGTVFYFEVRPVLMDGMHGIDDIGPHVLGAYSDSPTSLLSTVDIHPSWGGVVDVDEGCTESQGLTGAFAKVRRFEFDPTPGCPDYGVHFGFQ